MSTAASIHITQINKEIEKIPVEYYSVFLKMVRVFNESISFQPAEISFRQGWHEAMTNETHPVSELWDGIDAN